MTQQQNPQAEPEENKGGRPTKWTPEINDELVKFFSAEPWKEREVTTVDKKGNESTRYEVVAEEFPTFERFASNNDLNCDTLVEWAKKENEDKYPGFSAAYTRAKQLQKDFLLANALTGRYNPQFSIFFAKNNLGMKDKVEVDNSGEVTLKGYAVVPAKAIEEPEAAESSSVVVPGKEGGLDAA